MNNKQKKTLSAIFEQCSRSDIAWNDVESLLWALGAAIKEGRGSRLKIFLNDEVGIFHRPHPSPNVSKAQAKSVRDFLIQAKIFPD